MREFSETLNYRLSILCYMMKSKRALDKYIGKGYNAIKLNRFNCERNRS